MFLKDYYPKLKKKYSKIRFSGISFDTRSIKKNHIFFAIKGIKDDGNKYIKNAILKGCKIIISEKRKEGFFDNVLYLKNKNPRLLLTNISAKIFSQKPKNLIAVTGTNGKSSIADFYYQILKFNKVKVASIGTLGVKSENFKKDLTTTTLDPIFLGKILNILSKNKVNNVILEASSHGLKQHRLDGLRFNIGIFTNLSRDHLDYHKTYKDYLNSKLILFRKLMKKNSTIIYDEDARVSKQLKFLSKIRNFKNLTIGSKSNNFKIINHQYLQDKQRLTFYHKKNKFEITTSLIGKIQLKNLMMAIYAAMASNLKLERILNSIQKLKPAFGRMQKVGNLHNNGLVILDYAHTPEALETCLGNIKDQFKLRKLNLVFGCGGERDKPKRKMMGKIANKYCNKIFLTDDNPRSENPKKIREDIKSKISKHKVFEISSRKEAINRSIKEIKSDEILVIAGKGHESYQEYKKKLFFSDHKCILQAIKIKNKSLSRYWKNNIFSEVLNNKIDKRYDFNQCSINSKTIKKNDIFFSLRGKMNDGNKFADIAIRNGAAISVISKNLGKKNRKKIKVKNVLRFLTDYSKRIRASSNASIISVTGSSGKTSVKEILGATFSNLSNAVFSRKSFNNKIGVPISLTSLNKNSDFGIFEVGMDKKGEINNLTKIIKPNVGIITNISYAHAKNFKNINGIAKAKSELIDNIVEDGYAVLNSDDKFFEYFKTKSLRKKLNVISFGKNNKSDIKFLKLIKLNKKLEICIIANGELHKFQIQRNFKSYIHNILATIAVFSIYFDLNKINKKIFLNLKILNGRGDFSKVKFRKKLFFLLDESYNSNPLSLNFAIENFNNLNVDPSKKILLLGDMLELGKFSKRLHKEAAENINMKKIEKIYVFGRDIIHLFNKIKPQMKGKVLKSKKEILFFFEKEIKNGDYLMIKGSNSTGLNSIAQKIKSRSKYAL